MRAAAAQIDVQEGSGGRYEGQVNQGAQRHGQGVMIRSDGSRYEGEFRNDLYHGHGTCTYPYGRVESGEWDNSRFLG